MRILIKLFTFVLFIGTAVFPIYAFASSNSEVKAAGEGTGAISGWTTSNINYHLANDPAWVKGVSFDLDGPANTVAVKLNSNSTTYANCTNVDGYHWYCDFASGVNLSSMDEFRVIAVGN
jgi:hypothetical protein